MSDFEAYLSTRRALIDRELARRLPAPNARPAGLHRAMRYSVLAGGKRLRPILCLAAAEAAGGSAARALLPALAIELLHTYTLIHDDLPCMDDDALRRGRPTCHVVFGEATAVLAGDALLTMAFEWMAAARPPPPWSASDLARELAYAAGSSGVVGGQAEDLAAEGKKPDAARVAYIHRHKTAVLIAAAARIGGMCAGARRSRIEALARYGEKAGLAFQIVDDILNETSTPEQMGKAAGSDRKRGKMTWLSIVPLEQAASKAGRLAAGAVRALDAARCDTRRLAGLVNYIVTRKR